CDKEMCAFRDSMDKLNGLNAQVVGVSVDSYAALKAFANQYKLQFPLLTDFNREVIAKYDVLWKGLGGIEGYNVANRAVFILDKNGVVHWKWVAEKPGIEPAYDQITAELAKLPR
ncbi:MAG: redoxin domain-containing protein, partial [Chloroflexota bacterium]